MEKIAKELNHIIGKMLIGAAEDGKLSKDEKDIITTLRVNFNNVIKLIIDLREKDMPVMEKCNLVADAFEKAVMNAIISAFDDYDLNPDQSKMISIMQTAIRDTEVYLHLFEMEFRK